MPFGIIFEGTVPAKPAQFYIPSGSQAGPASHVYLGRLPEEGIPEDLLASEKTVLLDLQEPVLPFLAHLRDLKSHIAVVAPVSEDPYLFAILKDSHLPLVLRYHSRISAQAIERFKCLKYGAVLVDQQLEEVPHAQISSLLAKTSRPSLITFEHLVKDVQKWQQLAVVSTSPYSDMLITPLQPLTHDLPVSVYEEFEKDTSKYMQYRRAIEMALDDLHQKTTSVKVLVVGPGRGPLLQMVAEHACVQDTIDVAEKNATVLPFLHRICSAHAGMTLFHRDCRQMAGLDTYDLVVSELLGSFGCNEACPEILNFRSNAVFIPQTFSGYLQPVYSDVLGNAAAESSACSTPLYLAKLNSAFSCCVPAEIFEFSFPGPNNLSPATSVSFAGTGTANALRGYFSATLYGPYQISILPGSHASEFCQSWFPMIFPIHEVSYPVTVEMRRCSADSLRYEWTVNGTTYRSTEFGL